MAASDRLEEVFEASSPLAQRLAAEAPFGSDEELMERARLVAGHLSEAEKIGTLNAHPRIGERADRLSSRSLAEQGAGILPELERLNREYESKFGFRFVVFVNRRPKSEIVEVLRDRLANSREDEMRNGLDAILDIAADRLRR